MTYILTSLTLAILLPLLLAGAGHEEVGNVSIYRYPKRLRWFFLGALPVYGAMGLFIYSTMSPAERASFANVAGFGACWTGILGLLVVAYFYLDRYRVQIDDRTLTIKTIFGGKVLQLARVAQIALLKGRATDLVLLDEENHVLVKLGGSLQDFESFLSELKLRTRSPQVMLFRWGQWDGWRECVNNGAEHWIDSGGPKLFRDTNRHVKYILIVGFLLIVLAVIASDWYGKAG